jgi:hypothetical protein
LLSHDRSSWNGLQRWRVLVRVLDYRRSLL